jgi:hypothetical protein
MQIPTRNIHTYRILRRVESSELNIQLTGMGGLDSRFASGEEELLQTRVPERLNHAF